MESNSTWFVRGSGFMERVAPEDRDTFLRVCPERRYQPGESVFRIGDPATDLHIIARGKIKLVRPTVTGHERIVAICGPDDFIGEAFVRDADHYRVDAVALSEVTTCPIDRDQFKQVAARAPGFALTFAEVLASHLHYCRDQMSASYDPVRVRVAKILLEQAERFGQPLTEPGWVRLDTELRHEDLAALASATRVAITMGIGELREQGLLRGSRGHYELDVDSLRAATEELIGD